MSEFVKKIFSEYTTPPFNLILPYIKNFVSDSINISIASVRSRSDKE